jgi:hypothetical protein
MFMPQQPNPELEAAMMALHEAQAAAQLEQRANLVRFAAVACSCQRRYSWESPAPPQLDCIIHGSLMMDAEGRLA